MEAKSKSNFSNMEQKELSKLINDKTIAVKPANKEEAVVILSTGHYQSMITHLLLDQKKYKNPESCIANKLDSKLQRFLCHHKMCFTEPEWKCLNDKRHKVRNFQGPPKIYKCLIVKSVINTQNSELMGIFEPNDVKLRSVVGGPKCTPRELTQLIDILLKPFLNHIKSYIRSSLDFFN